MNVVRHDRADTFLQAAGAFLSADEARFHLPLAVAGACREDPGRYPGPNWFAVVEESGRVAGVGLLTPPHRAMIYAPPAAAGLLAEDLAAGEFPVPGAHGPVDGVDCFAAAWTLPRGLAARRHRDLRSFALDRVTPPPPTPGRMRPAGEGDLEIAEEFHAAFVLEAHLDAGASTPRQMAERAVATGRLFLWQDGVRVVSQATLAGFSPTGARIGAVYTPPGDRRSGYATALVAALSARALAEGRRRCFLFTDLANPVSNSIYPRIGYRPVADYREWEW